MKSLASFRRSLAVLCLGLISLFAGSVPSLLGVCGPFTDVAADAFCPFVLEIFYLGITTGTTPTTYDPASTVNRLQMAAFLSRSVDGVLRRGSRRAALKQFWAPQNDLALGMTTVGDVARLVQSDGADLWVAINGPDLVSRVRASDGRLLESWTGATAAYAPLVAAGRVFVTGIVNPGRLYRIDPTQAAGVVTTVASNLGDSPVDIAFDGSRIWTVNVGDGSISIVTPAVATPWPVTTLTAGFAAPFGMLYDGTNVWVTDQEAGTLLRLDGVGAVLQTVTVGALPAHPVFDGTNIWVPNVGPDSVSVVRASNGSVLATLTGNGLDDPVQAAFDGQRVLLANAAGNSVSLWKAADLTSLGSFSLGAFSAPAGACSDGVNFWITLEGADKLARF